MALKRLKIKLAQPTPTEAGSEIPVVAIDGDLIKQYNEAADQVKRGEELMEDLRPDVMEIVLGQIFTRGCKHPATPPTSVKIQDDEGEVLMGSFTKKYKEIADVDAVEALFEEHNLDINTYVTEGVKASFDDKVFYDQDGNFLQDVYDDMRKAVQTVVTRRQLTKNPLETTKIVKVKEVFHGERFTLMPNVESQQQVFLAMPNQVTLKPVRANTNGKGRK